MSLDPRAFRRQHFGIGSSHPEAQVRTARVFALGALIPMGVLALLSMLIAIEAPDLLFDLDWLQTGLQLFLLAGLFALSVAVTVGLYAGIARRWAREKGRIDRAPDRVGVIWIVVGVVLGIVIPTLGPNLQVLPDSIRFLCRVAAVLPTLLILLYIAGGRSSPDEGDKVEAHRPLASLLLLPIGLIALQSMLVTGLEALGHTAFWASLGGLLPFMEDVPRRIGAASVVFPMVVVLQVVRHLWPRELDREVAARRERDAGSREPGFLRRIWVWILRFLGWLPKQAVEPADPEAEELDDEGRPVWLMKLLERAEEGTPEDAGLRSEVRRYESGRASSPVETGSPELVTWFPGLEPTRDQVLALEQYLGSHERSLQALRAGEALPSSDLLLVGEAGAGRSTTLYACILAAVTIRGQGALVLVPDRSARALVIQRLQRRIDALGFRHLIEGRELDSQFVERWIAAKRQESGPSDAAKGAAADHASSERGLPEILVATPDDLERCLISYVGNSEEMALLRQLVGNYEALFLEDLSDFGGTHRVHLPFQLDKLRLLHAAEHRQVQVLAVARPMGRAGWTALGERLFGIRGFDAEQSVVHIRPRVLEPCWHAELNVQSADRIEGLRDLLASLVVEERLHALLYRRDIDPDEALKHERRLGSDRLRIIGSLDQVELLGDFEAQLALYTEVPRVKELFQVRAVLGGTQVVVSLSFGKGVTASDTPLEVVPVFPQREAEALGALHLASVLPLLPSHATVPDGALRAVGFQERLAAPIGGRTVPKDAWMIDSLDSIPGYERLAYLGTHPEARPLVSVEQVAGLDRYGFQVHGDHGASRFLLRPEPRDETELGALATWRHGDAEGEHLGTLELGHLGEMRSSQQRARFVPRGLEFQQDGRLAVIAGASVGPEQDSTHPILDLEASFEACEGVRIRFHMPERGLSLSSAKNPCASLTTTLQGLANGITGAETQYPPYRFEQRCWVGALLIGPARLPDEARTKILARLFQGRRSTAAKRADAGYLPALTSALNRALELHYEGSAWFCRVAAFALREELGGQAPAEAVCYLYEPEGTGAAVAESLDKTLRVPEMSRAFLQTAMDVLLELEDLQDAGPEAQAARMRSLNAPCVTPGPEARVRESIVILERAIKGEGAHQGIEAGWRPGIGHHGTVEPHEEQIGREWATEDPCSWGDLTKSLVDPLADELERTPDLVWQVSLMGPTAENLRDGLEKACRERCQLGFGDLHVTLRPLEGQGPDLFAAELATALEAVFTASSKRQSPVSLGIRLWGTSRSKPRTPGRPYPLDRRIEIGISKEGDKVYRTRRREAAPDRLDAPNPLDIFIPDFIPAAPAEEAWQPVEWYVDHEVGDGRAQQVEFEWGGRSFTVAYGAPRRSGTHLKEAKRLYLELLDGFSGRTGGPDYANHLRNDPLHRFVADLSATLQASYPGTIDADYAEFALRFVQAMPYIPDPDRPSDWPRFPSETLLLGGGDCEDSSMLYAALLLDAGLDAAWLSFEGHLAVGVRGPFDGRFYEHLGASWFLAETAVNAGSLPIGSVPDEGGALEEVRLCPPLSLSTRQELSILRAWLEQVADQEWVVRVTLFSPGGGGEIDLLLLQRPLVEEDGERSLGDHGPTRSLDQDGRGRSEGSSATAFEGSECASAPHRLAAPPTDPALVEVTIPIRFSGKAYLSESAIDLVVLRGDRPRRELVTGWWQVATFLPDVCS